jgi:GTP cyclohydrolase I
MAQAIRDFLSAAGLDVDAPQLAETPARVAETFRDSFLDGYDRDPKEILAEAYPVARSSSSESEPSTSSGMVLLRGITFHGLCPHHLLPFHGLADVAYLPTDRLASLGSLSRLVDCFAHRLEIQETVTRQIAETLFEELGAEGTAVVLETDQSCLTMRGVEKVGARTLTRHFTGAFAERSDLRLEFLGRLDSRGADRE